MKSKLIYLLMTMVIIAAMGAIFTKLVYSKSDLEAMKSSDKINIVTTIYPVYLIGLNLADQTDNIEITSLINRNTGCLHDYQLTAEDMKTIATADVLVINGGGMEGFLEDITANYPDLTIIDASKGITMLEDGEEGPKASEDEIEDSVGGAKVLENGAEAISSVEYLSYNSHVWLDPSLYEKQIENIRDGIINYIKSSKVFTKKEADSVAKKISENAKKYMEGVQNINTSVEDIRKSISGNSILPNDSQQGSIDNNPNGVAANNQQDSVINKSQGGSSNNSNAITSSHNGVVVKSNEAVIFHEAFAYLAERVGMKIAFSVEIEPDTSLSAGNIADIVKGVKEKNIRYLFTEEQYSDSIPRQIAEETNANVYVIDSIVTGDGSKDSYFKAMQRNLNILKKATN